MGLEHLIIVLCAALLPPFLLLRMVYRMDRVEPEPRPLLIRLFVWGVLCALPVMVLELWGQDVAEQFRGSRALYLFLSYFMELLGVITALEALKEPCAVDLYSDSKYVVDALTKGWAEGWRRRGWVKADKKPALNPDLWARLLDLTARHELTCHWVKGHAENEYNNRCDALAVAQRDKYAKE